MILGEEVIASVTKAAIVIAHGEEIEILAVLCQVPQFISNCADGAKSILLPEICRCVLKWTSRIQAAAAEVRSSEC